MLATRQIADRFGSILIYRPKRNLFEKLRQHADSFWYGKSYIIVFFMLAAIPMIAGTPLLGGLLLAGAIIFLLLFCEDILSIVFPGLLISLLSTAYYSNLTALLPYRWVAAAVGAALLLHLIIYAKPLRTGISFKGLAFVSAATVLGGLGSMKAADYLTFVTLYYSLGLGLSLLVGYLLFRSQLQVRRRYDPAKRFITLLYAIGVFTGLVIALFYIRNIKAFTEYFAVLFMPYRNFCATILLICLPTPFYFFARRPVVNSAGVLFLYGMLLMAGSRSGLLFGTALLVICCIYTYYTNPKRQKTYRKIALYALPFFVLFLIGVVWILYASRVMGAAVFKDSRVTFFHQGIHDFLSNPIFGIGLGNMRNSVIFIGVTGSMVWYHNYLVQIFGSMGLVGAAAYFVLLRDRIRLMCRKHSLGSDILALSYLGMLLVSLTNPGEFCPLPNALLMVLLFAIMEELPDSPASLSRFCKRAAARRQTLPQKFNRK